MTIIRLLAGSIAVAAFAYLSILLITIVGML